MVGFLHKMENISNSTFCQYDDVIVMGDYNADRQCKIFVHLLI